MIDKNTLSIISEVSRRLDELGTPPETPLLDLGCGRGLLLTELLNRGFTNLYGAGCVITVPSQVAPIGGIDFCIEGWHQVFKGQTFKRIVCTELIEHLTNPYLFLREVEQILAPDGVVLMTTPNVHSLRSIIGYALKGRFSGFFGPNWTYETDHPIFDQHIFVPNIHLLKYYLTLSGFSLQRQLYLNGWSRLFSQTLLLEFSLAKVLPKWVSRIHQVPEKPQPEIPIDF